MKKKTKQTSLKKFHRSIKIGSFTTRQLSRRPDPVVVRGRRAGLPAKEVHHQEVKPGGTRREVARESGVAALPERRICLTLAVDLQTVSGDGDETVLCCKSGRDGVRRARERRRLCKRACR